MYYTPSRPADNDKQPTRHQRPPGQNPQYLQKQPEDPRRLDDYHGNPQERPPPQQRPPYQEQGLDRGPQPQRQFEHPQDRPQPPYGNMARGFERPPPGFNPQFPPPPPDRFNNAPYDPVYADDRYYRPISAPYGSPYGPRQQPYGEPSPQGLRGPARAYDPRRVGPPQDFRGPPPDYRGLPPPDFRDVPPEFRGIPPPEYRRMPPQSYQGGEYRRGMPEPMGYRDDYSRDVASRGPDYRGGPPPDFRGGPPPDYRGLPPPGDFRGGPPPDFRKPPPDYRGMPPHQPDYRGMPPPPPDYRGMPPPPPEYRGMPPANYRGPPPEYGRGMDPRGLPPPGEYRRAPGYPQRGAPSNEIYRGDYPPQYQRGGDQVYRGGPGGRDFEPRRPLSPQSQRRDHGYNEFSSPQQRIKQA
ncbi:unnamed protein product [Paramecium pentaurelia]|uniref:Uncharacterized protein n=1 Tax=Paramecium pentaurelia TaxID=43138 RepID=A0A8S1RXD1_9CILI|nr:unnamed protein product [Paramecium pentaurelia]